MNTLDKKYQQLLSDIIEFGVEKKDRTGTGTISEFGHQIRHNSSDVICFHAIFFVVRIGNPSLILCLI